MGIFLPKLDKTMPIVGFKLPDRAGRMVEHVATATPQMQRFWQTQSLTITGATGGQSFTAETASASYDPDQMQRVIDAVAGLYRGLG